MQEACEQSVEAIREDHGNKIAALEKEYADKMTDLEYQIEMLQSKTEVVEETKKLEKKQSEQL